MKIKQQLSTALDKLPYFKKLKDKLLLSYYSIRYKYRRSKQPLPETIEIKPSCITKALVEDISVGNSLGRSLPGDWDRNLRDINEMDVFLAFEERINKGKDWKKTDYYKRVIHEVEAGAIKWGCKTKAQVDNRFESFDNLINSLKTNGIIKASDRSIADEDVPFYDDVIVCVDRDGRYLLHDGRHRLIIAQLLKLDSITVRVSMRHKIWVSFCEKVLAYAHAHEKLYAPVLHQDLSFIESQHNHERFLVMKENLPIKNGSLLDIGSHWGYFCHQFENIGFKCTAIEPDINNAYFINNLKKASSLNFNVENCKLFNYEGTKSFDIVLALYIFHHFIKTKEDTNKLREFLSNLDANYMFFSTHSADEPQMKGAYKNYPPEEFADFIIESSQFTHKKCLKTFDNGRKLYLLSRSKN